MRVSRRGAARWAAGHPWIYRSDVVDHPEAPGLVRVADERGRFIGQALYSPRSEIRLRLLEPTTRPVDGAWWRERLAAALWLGARGSTPPPGGWCTARATPFPPWWSTATTAGSSSSSSPPGWKRCGAAILDALVDVVRPEGILLRNDVGVRRHEGLKEEVELAWGSVPEQIEVREGPVRFLAAPRTGQKTGAFLDQRPNRLVAGELARQGGTALDCFTYHGSFALHLARSRRATVVAVDASAEALARGAENAAAQRAGQHRVARG